MVALVTGGSSGIGLEAVKELARRGLTVYALSRRGIVPGLAQDAVKSVHGLKADVTDESAVEAAVKTIIDQSGRIDVLINGAGYGISGAIEFTRTEDAKKMFDADFFGTVSVTKAVLPYMRKAGRGTIVNISSVAAPAAVPFQAYYSASKAALNAYSLALRNEVRPFGIKVALIQPGDIHTGFTAARLKDVEGDDIYQGRIARSVASMEHDELGGMPAREAGIYVAKVALKKNPRPIYTLRFLYKLAAYLLKLLPMRPLSWLVYMVYGR